MSLLTTSWCCLGSLSLIILWLHDSHTSTFNNVILPGNVGCSRHIPSSHFESSFQLQFYCFRFSSLSSFELHFDCFRFLILNPLFSFNFIIFDFLLYPLLIITIYFNEPYWNLPREFPILVAKPFFTLSFGFDEILFYSFSLTRLVI